MYICIYIHIYTHHIRTAQDARRRSVRTPRARRLGSVRTYVRTAQFDVCMYVRTMYVRTAEFDVYISSMYVCM